MVNENQTEIGKLVSDTISLAILQNNRGRYTFDDYIHDFKGTQEECNIALIKLAAKEL